MELEFNTILSIGGGYVLQDIHGKVYYKIKGVPLGAITYKIFDEFDNEVAVLKTRMFNFLSQKYDVFQNNVQLGTIIKHFSLFRPKITMDFCNWGIVGALRDCNYKFYNGAQVVGSFYKVRSGIIDKYIMHVENEQDILYCLLIGMAIDLSESRVSVSCDI